MFTIKDNIIRMTRGDDISFDIDIKTSDGQPYELQDGDVVEFAVKPATDFSNNPYKKAVGTVIKKTGPTVTIGHADTKNLPFGEYVYDVQITYANGERETIIVPTTSCGKVKPNLYLLTEVNVL